MISVALVLLAILLGVTVLAVALRRVRPAPLPPTDAPTPRDSGLVIEIPEGIRPVERPPTPRPPPLPVVLVHGLFGFDHVGVPGARLHYFRGVIDHLASLGCHAHAVRLPRAASVPDRARILADKIAELGHERIDLIAHSLGGLDARYAVSKLGIAARVRSLVTIGTPHRGTPIADLATEGPLAMARKAIAAIGVPLEALDWLSTAGLEKFNREVLDVPGVRYGCVVGGIRQPSTPVSLAIAPAHAFLRKVAGPNDGLVPMSSQYWGETIAEIEADHFEQIGWRMPMRGSFDALAMYAFIVARLGDAPAVAAIACA